MPNRPMPNQGPTPPFYLNQQQLHMLQTLQKNKDNLNQQQLNIFGQLMNSFRMMQQHQHQMRLQQQQQQQQPPQQQQQMPIPSQQQITSPNIQQGYPQTLPSNQNGMYPYNSSESILNQIFCHVIFKIHFIPIW